MTPRTHAELVAEITELQRQQSEDSADAVFGGLTREQEVAHQLRADRLELLVSELAALTNSRRNA